MYMEQPSGFQNPNLPTHVVSFAPSLYVDDMILIGTNFYGLLMI